jgi:hypothetical protein
MGTPSRRTGDLIAFFEDKSSSSDNSSRARPYSPYGHRRAGSETRGAAERYSGKAGKEQSEHANGEGRRQLLVWSIFEPSGSSYKYLEAVYKCETPIEAH